MSYKKYPNKLAQVRSGLNVQLFNRDKPQLTQEALGRMCGVTRQTIAVIENEMREPSYFLALRIYMILSKYKAIVGYTLNLKLQELFPVPPLDNSPIKSAKTACPEATPHL